MRIGSVNLDYGWTPARQGAVIARLMGQGLDVLATQEDVTGRHRERIRVAQRHVLARGRHRANLTRLGYLIRLRWFAWVCLLHEDVPVPFYVISVHFPPARMPLLYPLVERRLRAFLASLEGPWVVIGDWNRTRAVDPAALKRTFGARFYGTGIDLAAVHSDLVPYVAGVRSRPRAGTHVHPVLVLTLDAAARDDEEVPQEAPTRA